MVLIFIGCIAAAGAIGFLTATLFKAGADHRVEHPHGVYSFCPHCGQALDWSSL